LDEGEQVIRRCRRDAGRRWLADLAAMVQVSLVAYVSAGAFLGLAYFDYFYNLVLVVAVANQILATEAVGGASRSLARSVHRKVGRRERVPTRHPRTQQSHRTCRLRVGHGRAGVGVDRHVTGRRDALLHTAVARRTGAGDGRR